jgi:SAM-dependent methyltransferase
VASEARPYYADRGLSAVYYDLITAHDPTLEGDVAFYAGLAPPGGEVLELGAGTGRVAFGLAERGLRVTGVELAPAMLAQATAKQAELDPQVAERVTLRLGDMTQLRLDALFDVVICAFFGLACLPAGAAWKNAFAVMARHLKPDGRVAVHLPSPGAMAEPAPAEPDRAVFRAPLGEGGRALQLFVRERSFRPRIGRFDQVLDYVVTDPRGAVERRSFERQTYYAADPAPFAAAAGLVPDREPVPLADVGEIHVFRRT